MLMRGFVAQRIGGDFFEQHRDRFFEHPALLRISGEEIFLSVTDDLHVQSRFLFALSSCGFLRKFMLVDMPSRRHPAAEALVPEKERALFGVDDEGGSGEVAVHYGGWWIVDGATVYPHSPSTIHHHGPH